MIWLFAINAVLNLLWSPLFFKLHRPDWALYRVGFFWLSIVALVVIHVLHHAARRLADASLSRMGYVRGLAQLARRRAQPAFRRARDERRRSVAKAWRRWPQILTPDF